jgi:hypothetical protein
MPIPIPKVEIGFDVFASGEGPFFFLDDPVRGLLDNTEFLLAGTIFFDVTDKVRTIAIQRGKNRELDQFDPGLANVVFNNNDRTFDPEFEASPFFGQIIPKRQIRISSGNIVQFFGVIDDWNLTYEPNGDSLTSAACSDATSFFANQFITQRTNSVELSGERINTILSLPTIAWPIELRDIEPGRMTLGADTIAEGTDALSYLRLVEQSEPGSFFIGKDGTVTFKDRNVTTGSGLVTLADDGSGIPYASIKVEYGSENLHNEIRVTSAITNFEVIALAQDSIDEYGVLGLNVTGLLINDDSDVESLAVFYANKYKDPEYRFDSVDLILDQRSVQQQQQILGLEINDIVEIKFTPNGIAPAIVKFAEVIAISQSIDVTNHVVQLGFSTIENAAWTLSDPVFGRLSAGNVLTF